MNPAIFDQSAPEQNQSNRDFSPLKLLEQLSNSQANGYLQVSCNSVNWQIYFNLGKLLYATHSLEPFERLDRHLRRLSNEISVLNSVVRTQARLNFEPELQNNPSLAPDYQAICWLVEQQYLKPSEAVKLLKEITIEVFESYLLLKEGVFQFISNNEKFPKFHRFEIQSFIKECQQRLQAWQLLGSHVSSPEQRPYLVSQLNTQQKFAPEKQEKLSKLLKGFSFRQLSVLTQKDELKLAQGIYPLIRDKIVILRDPQPPFDKLPKFSPTTECSVFISEPTINKSTQEASFKNTLSNLTFHNLPTNVATKTYKVICIDDSPTILKEINRFLEDYDLELDLISDSGKALREIIRIKPDLILMDVGMPNIDGYKLCRLIRNHSLFQTTPVIMVTGNTSLIDRAKARIAGATDYMTKPFTQAELVKMVFRYLT